MHYQNEFQAAEFTLLGNLFLSEGKQGKGKRFNLRLSHITSTGDPS